MNLDEYIQVLAEFESDAEVMRLKQYLISWKADNTDVFELACSMESMFGNIWIESTDAHNRLYRQWAEFKANTVDSIGGMTINERLYHFGLFDRFDDCKSLSDKDVIYSKLAARR